MPARRSSARASSDRATPTRPRSPSRSRLFQGGRIFAGMRAAGRGARCLTTQPRRNARPPHARHARSLPRRHPRPRAGARSRRERRARRRSPGAGAGSWRRPDALLVMTCSRRASIAPTSNRHSSRRAATRELADIELKQLLNYRDRSAVLVLTEELDTASLRSDRHGDVNSLVEHRSRSSAHRSRRGGDRRRQTRRRSHRARRFHAVR